MGAIGGILGLGGGASGSGFAAPAAANLQWPTNIQQIGSGYTQTQNSLQQQQQLLDALRGVNGIQNQQGVFNQMQGTAGQFQNLANGVGPNPAQAALAQNTAANVGQTGALMAGQRGSSANVGQIARQAGQQGAAIQQQGAGQAATLGAQQQIMGLQGLQQQQQNLANVSGQQVTGQVNQTNALNQANQNQYNSLLNAMAGFNNAQVGMQSNINTTNAGLAGQKMGQQGDFLGGVSNAVGALGDMLFASGGEATYSGQSDFGKFVTGMGMAKGGDARSGGVVKANSPDQKAVKGGNSYSNDKIPAVLSEGEVVLPRSVTQSRNPVEAAARFVEAVMRKKGKA
jgi:hypothetical protein